MTKIVIISGYGGYGGSTIAHISLCNLFNEHGHYAIFVSPGDWSHKCRHKNITEFSNEANNYEGFSVIYHFLDPGAFARIPGSIGMLFDRIILSCHETNLYPLKEAFPNGFGTLNAVHLVSKSQKEWHGIEDERIKIIPNVVRKVDKVGDKSSGIAGVIGSIDRHKRTKLAIKEAIKNQHKTIKVIGHVTDPEYLEEIKASLPKDVNVIFTGHVDDVNDVYRGLQVVYHTSKRETFNFIKPECKQAGVKYYERASANAKAEYWQPKQIIDAWVEIL